MENFPFTLAHNKFSCNARVVVSFPVGTPFSFIRLTWPWRDDDLLRAVVVGRRHGALPGVVCVLQTVTCHIRNVCKLCNFRPAFVYKAGHLLILVVGIEVSLEGPP